MESQSSNPKTITAQDYLPACKHRFQLTVDDNHNDKIYRHMKNTGISIVRHFRMLLEKDIQENPHLYL